VVLRFLARRFALTIPVLLGVATLVFSLIHLIPGDPAQAMLGESARRRTWRSCARAGLDRPLVQQYGRFSAARCGRLGRIAAHEPAGHRGDSRTDAATIELAAAAMLVRSPLHPARHRPGLARHGRRSWRDDVVRCSVFSIPNFWLAAAGDRVLDRARMAAVSRTRKRWRTWCCQRCRSAPRCRPSSAHDAGDVLEELREQYVTASRARGASRARAVVRHAFRTA